MYRLTAVYNIILTNPIRIKRAEGDPLCYTACIDEFDIKIILIKNGGARIILKNEVNEIREVNQIDIRVQRDEKSEPPEIRTDDLGHRNFTERVAWFKNLYIEYQNAAVVATNRLIRYFKFEMNTPHLQEYSKSKLEFNKPIWENKEGKVVESGIYYAVSRMIPGPGLGLIGEKDFTEDEDANLTRSLQNPIGIDTFREFLSDAQSSILTNKLNRAILEMAIACEILVKRAFFSKKSVSGAAYEYLEDKGKFNIKVIELIDGVSKAAFSQSFKEIYPEEYTHIDFLFRARNKVAHRGEAYFRNDEGKELQVERSNLEKWWVSVEKLIVWINEKSNNLNK